MGQVDREGLLHSLSMMLPLLGRAAVRCPAWLFVVAWARAATIPLGIASHIDTRAEERWVEGLTLEP